MKDKDILLIGVVGIGGWYLLTHKEEIEKVIPSMPSIDLSGLLAGLHFPAIKGGSLSVPNLLAGLGIQTPQLDLSKLGLGLDVPQIDLSGIIPDWLKGLGREGEKAVTLAPEPSEQTWGSIAKGFVSAHPILASAIAIPLAGATAYGLVQASPYLAKGVGGIVSGVTKVSSNIYSVIKLPKGVSIWKTPVKALPSGVAAKGGIGIGGYGLMAMAGFGGATELARLVGWKPEMAYSPKYIGGRGVLGFLNRAIMFFSIPENIRGLVGGKVSAAALGGRPATVAPSIVVSREYYGEYYEAGVSPYTTIQEAAEERLAREGRSIAERTTAVWGAKYTGMGD